MVVAIMEELLVGSWLHSMVSVFLKKVLPSQKSGVISTRDSGSLYALASMPMCHSPAEGASGLPSPVLEHRQDSWPKSGTTATDSDASKPHRGSVAMVPKLYSMRTHLKISFAFPAAQVSVAITAIGQQCSQHQNDKPPSP